MMAKIVSFVTAVTLLGTPAFAAIQANSKQGVGTAAEKGISRTKNISKQKQKTQVKSSIKAKGKEKSLTKSIQRAKQLSKQTSITVTVNPMLIAEPAVEKLEVRNIGVFGKCKLFTKPPTTKKIYNTEIAPGIYDVTAQEYYDTVAKQQGSIECPECLKIAKCCLNYGILIRDAMYETRDTLVELLKDRQIKAYRTKKGTKIDGLSLEDLQKIFEINLYKVVKKEQKNIQITDPLVRLKQGGFYVYFPGGYINYTLPNTCAFNNISWLSQQIIGGVGFNIMITKGWGYTLAWNTIKQNRSFEQKIKNKQRTLAYLYTKGMAKQYFLSLKNAVNENVETQATINPSEAEK